MEIILSILVSTYNRADIFRKNISKMLECGAENVEFILCDNASTDSTWAVMQEIKDPRVVLLHNSFNYGFDNFWRISFEARGRYFMFVNDRDYISAEDIEILCRNLREIRQVDFISNEKRRYPPGYYGYPDALNIYFQSRHPGTLIYGREFCRKILSLRQIEDYLRDGVPQIANNYLVFQLLLNVENIYVYPRNIIRQPANRERIPQVRKEYYGSTYISLEYRLQEYRDWIAYGTGHINDPRTAAILLAVYRDSLMTVTWEYYMSMNIPGFAKRAHYEDHSANEWIFNGLLFYFNVRFNKKFKRFHLDKEIFQITWEIYKETLGRVLE